MKDCACLGAKAYPAMSKNLQTSWHWTQVYGHTYLEVLESQGRTRAARWTTSLRKSLFQIRWGIGSQSLWSSCLNSHYSMNPILQWHRCCDKSNLGRSSPCNLGSLRRCIVHFWPNSSRNVGTWGRRRGRRWASWQPSFEYRSLWRRQSRTSRRLLTPESAPQNLAPLNSVIGATKVSLTSILLLYIFMKKFIK